MPVVMEWFSSGSLAGFVAASVAPADVFNMPGGR